MSNPTSSASERISDSPLGGDLLPDLQALSAHPGALLGLPVGDADSSLETASILARVLETVAGERAFLLEFPSDQESRVLGSVNFEGEEVLHPEEKIIWPLVERCRDRSEGFFTPELEKDPDHDSLRRSRQPRTRSLWIFPLGPEGHFLYVDHRFNELELASHAGGTIAWRIAQLAWRLDRERGREEAQSLKEEIQKLRKEQRRHRSRRERPRPTPAGPAGEATSDSDSPFDQIIGGHPDLLEILALIEKVAVTQAPVLINGESGTGKELIARALHRASHRGQGPFVTENCGALTETLLESELFGYVKGAFTGANEDHAGLFELASGGTLFLDEVGDTSAGMQKKLLRVVQEGVIRRVGGSEIIPVDVRIVSATNKDLFRAVQTGEFREDLYYRLNVINIHLPPLRKRKEDIPLLTRFFVGQLDDESGQRKIVTEEFLAALHDHDWPGNIRELQNEVHRTYALSQKILEPELLSSRVTQCRDNVASPELNLDAVLERGSLKAVTEALERQILMAALERFGENRSEICARLGIPKTTFYAKLKKFGLRDANAV